MILSLDTSTLTLSLALMERTDAGLRVVEQLEVGPPRKTSEMLPGEAGELLARHGMSVDRLEGITVGMGPGSFTGLRIGLSTVKALSYACEIPLGGASSLAAAAMSGPEGVPLFVIAVVKVGELYLGAYRREGRAIVALEPEDALTPEQLALRMVAWPDAVVLGPAVVQYRAALEGHGVPPERILSVGAVPSAAAVASLAVLPERYDAQAVFALEPHYVRASEPERNPKFPPLPGPPPMARIRED